MAKVKEEESQKESQKYQLGRTVREQGYFANIGGRAFIVSKGHREVQIDERDGNKKRTFVYGSVIEGKKETGKDFFENLTGYQIHLLAKAGVIILNKEQGDAYSQWLKEFYKDPDKFIPRV